MIDANIEIEKLEVPKVNKIAKDPAAIKEYRKNGNCL